MMMEIHTLLQELWEVQPATQLEEQIIALIQTKKMEQSRRLVWLFVFFSVLSAVAFIPALTILISDLNQSGFFIYIRLLLSDSQAVVSSWQSFITLLAESLPVVGLVLLLSAAIAFFGSTRLVIKHWQRHLFIA